MAGHLSISVIVTTLICQWAKGDGAKSSLPRFGKQMLICVASGPAAGFAHGNNRQTSVWLVRFRNNTLSTPLPLVFTAVLFTMTSVQGRPAVHEPPYTHSSSSSSSSQHFLSRLSLVDADRFACHQKGFCFKFRWMKGLVVLWFVSNT